MLDPLESTKGLLTHHILFDLVAHIEYRFVRETLVYILTPGDPFLKLTAELHAAVVSYCLASGLTRLLCGQVEAPNDLFMITEKQRLLRDFKTCDAIDALVEKLSGNKKKAPSQNLFQRIFNNFILGKLAKFTISHPEESIIGLPNIDGLPSPVFAKLSKKKMSVFGLSADMLRISNKLFDTEHHPGSNSNLDYEEPPQTGGSHSSLKRMNTLASKPDFLALPANPSKLKKSLTKIWEKLPFRSGPKRLPPSIADTPDVPGHIYREKIATYNVSVLESLRLFEENLEFNLKKERFVTCVLEAITSIVSPPLLQLENHDMVKMVGQPVSEVSAIKPLFFKSAEIYQSVLKAFIIRLEYGVINNADMSSVFVASKLIVLLLKHR